MESAQFDADGAIILPAGGIGVMAPGLALRRHRVLLIKCRGTFGAPPPCGAVDFLAGRKS